MRPVLGPPSFTQLLWDRAIRVLDKSDATPAGRHRTEKCSSGSLRHPQEPGLLDEVMGAVNAMGARHGDRSTEIADS